MGSGAAGEGESDKELVVSHRRLFYRLETVFESIVIVMFLDFCRYFPQKFHLVTSISLQKGLFWDLAPGQKSKTALNSQFVLVPKEK